MGGFVLFAAGVAILAAQTSAETNPRTLMPALTLIGIGAGAIFAYYQLAERAGHINVDTSRHAVAIERLLKEAVRVVSSMVAETLGQVE